MVCFVYGMVDERRRTVGVDQGWVESLYSVAKEGGFFSSRVGERAYPSYFYATIRLPPHFLPPALDTRKRERRKYPVNGLPSLIEF